MQILLCVPEVRWICDPNVSFSWKSFMISLKGIIRKRHICIREFIKILIAPHFKSTCLLSMKLRLTLSLVSFKKTLLLKWDCILKVFISLCVCPYMCRGPWRTEEGAEWPGTIVTGGCDPTDMCPWSETGVYCYRWLGTNWHVSLHKTGVHCYRWLGTNRHVSLAWNWGPLGKQ